MCQRTGVQYQDAQGRWRNRPLLNAAQKAYVRTCEQRGTIPDVNVALFLADDLADWPTGTESATTPLPSLL